MVALPDPRLAQLAEVFNSDEAVLTDEARVVELRAAVAPADGDVVEFRFNV